MTIADGVRLELLGVDPALIDRLWPDLLPFLEPAIARCGGLYLPEDVKEFCVDTKMQLWAVVRDDAIAGALVTEVVVYPRRKCLWIAFAGGAGIHDCPEITDILADWAAMLGCTAIRAEGRRGWVRAGGFEEMGTVMWRPITTGKETIQ
jgi:hypothetical protein